MDANVFHLTIKGRTPAQIRHRALRKLDDRLWSSPELVSGVHFVLNY